MQQARKGRSVPLPRRVLRGLSAALFVAGLAGAVASSTSLATPAAGCRIQSSAQIAAGDAVRGNAHSTDFVLGLGTGHWVHTTPAGERFRARVEILSCHVNTGNVGDFEGTGRFDGSEVDLTLMAHLEDRTPLGQADFLSMAIFDGPTLIYTTAGGVVEGDFRVQVLP